MTQAVYAHQIYYSEQTKQQIDSRFIPLDNSENLRADWYEFWVIRNYLHQHELAEDAFYGFFSPKFTWKTGLTGQQVWDFASHHADRDALFFSPAWDQVAYFLNPFEQGDYWHPELLSCTQAFLDTTDFSIDLKTHIGHSFNTCYSNFLLAKPRFWRSWLKLADLFFDYVECASDGPITKGTSYGTTPHLVPMKTFIQERFISLILAKNSYQVAPYDFGSALPHTQQLFGDHHLTRQSLEACNLLKLKYTETLNPDFLAAYWSLRKTIPLLIQPATLKSNL